MLRMLILPMLLAATAPATAAELRVGSGERFARPSAAAAAARPGDRILIRAGQYHDCAVWGAADLTIEAMGGVVEILGPVCAGKALFITIAPRITIVGITFRGAVAPSGNGAGIRAEGGDLTIRRSRFIENQNGILTAAYLPDATLLIEESVFIANGALEQERDCAHGLYAGHLGRVAIRRTRFEATRICHHVKSRALRTEIIDSFILDGPEGQASYLVDVPNGGDLLLRNTELRKGPQVGNPTAAVVIGAEGVRHPTNSLVIEANSFSNLMPHSTIFVRNLSQTPAEISGNRLSGEVVVLEGPGHVR
jgi:hypothetical protein